MMEPTTTIDEAADPTCTSCMTVPLSHLALEDGISVPIGGWSEVFAKSDIRVLVDTCGRPAISVLAARRLFAVLKRQAEVFAEDARRRSEKLARRHPVRAGGLPAQEGLTPFESLVAAGGAVSPQDEFGGGRPKPRFLEDEILAGEQEQAEKRRLAAERAAQRLADQMKDKLGGKP